MIIYGAGDSRFELELELVESKSTVLTVTLIANKIWYGWQDLNLRYLRPKRSDVNQTSLHPYNLVVPENFEISTYAA